jgi:hypothetical protein
MEIMQFFHRIREKAWKATVNMIAAKYLSLKQEENADFDLSEVDWKYFRRRLWRILQNNDVVSRCPTHQSQLKRTSNKDRGKEENLAD